MSTPEKQDPKQDKTRKPKAPAYKTIVKENPEAALKEYKKEADQFKALADKLRPKWKYWRKEAGGIWLSSQDELLNEVHSINSYLTRYLKPKSRAAKSDDEE